MSNRTQCAAAFALLRTTEAQVWPAQLVGINDGTSESLRRFLRHAVPGSLGPGGFSIAGLRMSPSCGRPFPSVSAGGIVSIRVPSSRRCCCRCRREMRMGPRYAERYSAETAGVEISSLATAGGRATLTMPPGYTETTDADLLAMSAEGDRRAFDEIVSRHAAFALRVALRIVANPAVAEELVQEAMVKAWSQSRHFDPRRARFSTWLYKIVVNLCLDYRRRKHAVPMPDGFDPVDPGPAADRMLEIGERDAAIDKAMQELPARQRAAMALVYAEGMSGSEAAVILGLSAKAVERLLARARAYVRESLRREHY